MTIFILIIHKNREAFTEKPLLPKMRLRVAIGNTVNCLCRLTYMELGTAHKQICVERRSIDIAAIDEVIMGNVLQAGLGQNPARQALISPALLRCTSLYCQ